MLKDYKSLMGHNKIIHLSRLTHNLHILLPSTPRALTLIHNLSAEAAGKQSCKTDALSDTHQTVTCQSLGCALTWNRAPSINAHVPQCFDTRCDMTEWLRRMAGEGRGWSGKKKKIQGNNKLLRYMTFRGGVLLDWCQSVVAEQWAVSKSHASICHRRAARWLITAMVVVFYHDEPFPGSLIYTVNRWDNSGHSPRLHCW